MYRHSLLTLTLGATLLMPLSTAQAAPDPNVDLIEMFARLPEYTLRYFGDYNHISTNLLDGKGVIVDKAKNYIEIPYAGNSNHPDRDKLYAWQMTAFRDANNKPVLVVNSMILSQTKVKPFLHVFRFNNSGYPYRTTERDFAFGLQYYNHKGTRTPYNYNLPRVGNTITSGLPETDSPGYSYRWTGRKFVQFRPKYKEVG